MDNLYNRFRFVNSGLFKKYNDKTVRGVFEDVWFFVNEFDLDEFTTGDIMFYINFGMNERGQIIPDINELAKTVITFITEEAGLLENHYDLYEDIYKVVSEVVPRYISDAEKFTEPLARRITDEFKDGDRSMTMDQIAVKLKTFPELRFLSLSLLEDVMDSVYDFFMKLDEEWMV